MYFPLVRGGLTSIYVVMFCLARFATVGQPRAGYFPYSQLLHQPDNYTSRRSAQDIYRLTLSRRAPRSASNGIMHHVDIESRTEHTSDWFFNSFVTFSTIQL